MYIYIYIYKSKHTRQRSAVATRSFTPVGDLQATDISNLPKKGKSTIFDQMGHRQANTSRQKRKTKLHSVPRGKADDHERPF